MGKTILQPPEPKSPYRISEQRRQELLAIAKAMTAGSARPAPPKTKR